MTLAWWRGCADRGECDVCGYIVESAPVHSIYTTPRATLTRSASSGRCRAWTRPLTEAHVHRGAPSGPGSTSQGCPFAPRCDYAVDRCLQENPSWRGWAGHSRRPAGAWSRTKGTVGRAKRTSAAPQRAREIDGERGTTGRSLVQVDNLKKSLSDHTRDHRPATGGASQGCGRDIVSTSFAERHWGWSARADAASRRPGGRCCSSTADRRGGAL